jgi:hypothetical protein
LDIETTGFRVTESREHHGPQSAFLEFKAATPDGVVLHVESVCNVTEAQARRWADDKLSLMEDLRRHSVDGPPSFFSPNRSRWLVAEKVDGKSGFPVYIYNTNRQFNYTFRSPSEIAYRTVLTFFYCSGSRAISQVAYSYPVDRFERWTALRDIEAVGCR